jgi:hypothetical protein
VGILQEDECKALLQNLLENSGITWQQDWHWIRFRFQSGGMVWETACRCEKGGVTAFGRYPFAAAARQAALEACSSINSCLRQGSLFLVDGAPVLRTYASLNDPYGAADALASMLEYNAAAIVQFWGKMQAACHGR